MQYGNFNISVLINHILIGSLAIGLLIVPIACNTNPTSLKNETAEAPEIRGIPGITELIKEDRTNDSLFHERALLHLKASNFEGALNDIKIAVKLDASLPSYHFTFGEILFAKGDIAMAATELETCASLDPKNKEALLKLAEVEMYMQQYKRSISTLKKVIALDQYNSNAFYIQGLIFKQMGDTVKAINSWEKAVDYNADFFDAYFQLGITQYELGKPIAEHYLSAAYALDPENMELIYALGMCYQKFGFTEKAIDTYYSLLEKNINHTKAHYNLGYIHLGLKKDYTTAHEHFENAIRCDSAYADAFYMRGLCEENLGNFRKARQDYKLCLDMETNHNLAIIGLNRLDDNKGVINNKKGS